MKLQAGILSLALVCGACSSNKSATETDVVKDGFDFASQQLKYAFTEVDSVMNNLTEEQKEKMIFAPVCAVIIVWTMVAVKRSLQSCIC